ncbi:hypothetical protein F4821DRAFT_265119 [Hypoxylon rubiginosum]|uniref:Uncharacterized protein n=1 Tax=Hypoxylon rubiginosum TaxID=110542 RepID=A0ACC0CLJ1_9PEZI|nr:hypothetical protein F4821DRAFT_265119 [Hypoxylon rubiginosum]
MDGAARFGGMDLSLFHTAVCSPLGILRPKHSLRSDERAIVEMEPSQPTTPSRATQRLDTTTQSAARPVGGSNVNGEHSGPLPVEERPPADLVVPDAFILYRCVYVPEFKKRLEGKNLGTEARFQILRSLLNDQWNWRLYKEQKDFFRQRAASMKAHYEQHGFDTGKKDKITGVTIVCPSTNKNLLDGKYAFLDDDYRAFLKENNLPMIRPVPEDENKALSQYNLVSRPAQEEDTPAQEEDTPAQEEDTPAPGEFQQPENAEPTQAPAFGIHDELFGLFGVDGNRMADHDLATASMEELEARDYEAFKRKWRVE